MAGASKKNGKLIIHFCNNIEHQPPECESDSIMVLTRLILLFSSCTLRNITAEREVTMSDTAIRTSQKLTSPLAELLDPLTAFEAGVEANRCLYCYDAPCAQACPTHIDIPGFIRKIAQDRPRDAGRTILSENLLGATCSRVCPVQELCEGACVLNHSDKPISIGRLQRFATDTLLNDPRPLFTPVASTGNRIAVVGAGPAGLSCAGELTRQGHHVEVFEKRELPGGLSTYGIVTLREPVEVALAEVEFLRRLGVIVHTGRELGKNLSWDDLESRFDAIFLGVGLGKVPLLGIPGDERVIDGLELVEAGKLNPTTLTIGRKVAVVGAGEHGHRLRHGRQASGRRRSHHRLPTNGRRDDGVSPRIRVRQSGGNRLPVPHPTHGGAHPGWRGPWIALPSHDPGRARRFGSTATAAGGA